jgi:hypothetical protein
MNCKNHPEVAAVDRCAGCARSFCADCLIDVGGQKFCNSCKGLATQSPSASLDPVITNNRPIYKRIVICAAAIIVCWFLPFYTFESGPLGRYATETAYGFEHKTGLVRMADGGLKFIPGALVPFCALLCFSAAILRTPWFTVAATSFAGILAVFSGLGPFIDFFGSRYFHLGIGAYLSFALGLYMLLLGFGILRDMQKKGPREGIEGGKDSGDSEKG